jgi:hypothetical protein
MVEFLYANKSFSIFINKRSFFIQKLSFVYNFTFSYKKLHYWFLYVQKFLYRFGLSRCFFKIK